MKQEQEHPPVDPRQLSLPEVVRVERRRPRLDVHRVGRLLRLEQLDHLKTRDFP